MRLIDALRTEDGYTQNGMTTNSTTLNSCVDLFFKIGAVRGKDESIKINSFTKAFAEDALTAMKILFWVRDIRGGAGERSTFKEIITYLATHQTKTLSKNLHLIPVYGRWDDLFTLLGTPLEKEALDVISKGLKESNNLCAKWMPRGNSKNSKKNFLAKKLREHLNLSQKKYRNLIVGLSNTIEQQMCAKEFDKINYSHVPSKAMSDYMRAFTKHDTVRFTDYLEQVNSGDVKINAGAIYPYDVLKSLKSGNVLGANTQWSSLPNYLEGNEEMVLPVVDVSYSMTCSAGGSPTLNCMDVAISLGLYISERNEGPFKNGFITFDNNPRLEYVSGSLSERYKQMKNANWGGSTNLEITFQVLLDKATKMNVPKEEMPTTILILSDMEFNRGIRGGDNPTAQKMIERLYTESGYDTPKIVYWNINASSDNNPVQFNKMNAALVSGFSPSILTSILSGEDMSPINIMYKTINSDRYSQIVI
tara:strand:+ start:561 stop:1991 length:1431 start_codon:yes stop_codon:yes gene_type:complete